MSASAPERPFSVRAARPEDAPEIAALFTSVFRRRASAAHVRWKLFDTPGTPGAPPSFLAESGGALVGQYAGTPIRFRCGAETRQGLHGCDVMTAEPMRRRGILTTVGTAAHQAWREAGLIFVTGLQNDAWGTRSAALGWENLFPLGWLVALLRPEAILAKKLGVPGLARASFVGRAARRLLARPALRDADLTVEEMAEAGGELDSLWSACRDEHEISVVRDRAWVAWRYLQAPSTRYRVLVARRRGRLAGYLAFSAGSIAELFTARDDAAAGDALLRRALALLHDEGAVSVRALAIPGSATWRSFRQAGFLPRGAYTFEVAPLDPALPRDVLADPRRWLIAGGDFDVV